VDAVQARLADPQNGAIAKSLSEVQIFSAVDLFATYAGRTADMGEWLRGAQINLDRNLRLQYLAGLGLNMNRGDEIYRHMSAGRRYPEELFTGSAATLESLRAKISATTGSTR
jgi:spermidine synthase